MMAAAIVSYFDTELPSIVNWQAKGYSENAG
jgi:hypothetical protein